MSFDLHKFIESPKDYVGHLQFAKKNELLNIAAQTKIGIPHGAVKKEILCIILDYMVSKAVITKEEADMVRPKTHTPTAESETEKLKLMLVLEQTRMEADRVKIEAERMKMEAEKVRMQMEQARIANLDIEYEKRLELERGLAAVENQKKLELERSLVEIRLQEKKEEKELPELFNLIKAQKLLPVFDEREPDVFFSTFENTAETLKWPSTEWVLLIRNAFKGKAASVSAQMIEERNYGILKRAILDAYSITAEGYRQVFRSSFKGTGQTFLEFCNTKLKQLGKWIDKENVTTFEELKNLILLEEFHRKIPTNISLYVKEKQEKDAKKAALLADEYHLIHKTKRVSIPSNQPKEYCSYCRMEGHSIRKCPNPGCKTSHIFSSPQQKTAYSAKPAGSSQPHTAVKSKTDGNHKTLHCAQNEDSFQTFKCKGKIGDRNVIILRDTGSSQTLISPKLKSLVKETQRYVAVSDLTCKTVLPIVSTSITCPYFTGIAEVAMLNKELPCQDVDVLLGNDLAENKVFQNLIVLSPEIVKEEPIQVITRTQKSTHIDAPAVEMDNKSNVTKEKYEDLKLLNVDLETFAQQQQEDETVKILFSKVRDPTDVSNKTPYFYSNKGLLIRHFRSPKLSHQDNWKDQQQLVVPTIYRDLLLRIAHASDSHLGVTKTYQRLAEEFYWNGMKGDVRKFVSTCHTCQIAGKPNQTIPTAPLIPVTVPRVPFEKVIIDCVGPFVRTKQGNEYLLTIMCPTTRFPIAIPIKNIAAKTIIKHLLHIFTVFGFPREIQCDRGTNFTSKIFSDTLKLFNIGHILASAYHPQTNGALERSHQTIKGLVRKYIIDTEKNWDEDLDLLMYVIRSVRNESTNISPFELLFGRKPRTILSVIKEKILQHHEESEALDLSKYLKNLQQKLQHLHQFAQENLKKSQDKMKYLFDKKTKVREFKIGEEVLLYHPTPGAPLKEKFQGPYTIIKRPSKVNYVLKTPDRRKDTQLVHVNLLKPYLRSHNPVETQKSITMTINHTLNSIKADFIAEEDDTDEVIVSWKDSTNSEILQSLPDYLQPIGKSLGQPLEGLIRKYSDICSDTPGKCSLGKHDVILESNTKPIRQTYYRISQERLKILKEEVDYLLDNNLATTSSSSWASPCLLVPKANNKFRMCTDYRKVNSVTIKDSFPLPRILDIIDSVSNSPYLTQIDLLKGYYQLELTERAKEISAFITPFGLFSYNVLPFGMCNAPATFQRIMQSIIQGLEGVFVYLDDIVVATATWEKHLQSLEEVFKRIRSANLTINLAKSNFGKATVTYLGHNIGNGKISPKDSNIQSILTYPTPKDRKTLKTFLGMTSYYSRFCPNYSTITGPLFDLTSIKRKFEWTTSHQDIFQQLKLFMTSYPILRAPNFHRRFYLQVDASNYGYGGVLLQSIQSDSETSLPPFHQLFPISYHSGRFTGAQLRWPTIEKELYSIVSSILHFKPYVEGQKETIVFSDHLPLCFLEKAKLTNQKLLRWSYILSASNIRVVRIPGTANTIADAMSRISSPSSV